MLLKLILFAHAITFVLTSSKLRLREIEKLIDRFNSQLDINYLFYDKVRSQKNNPLLCNAELGPYCHLVNGQSLLDKVDYANDSVDLQLKKTAMVQKWDQMHLQEQSTGTFYVFSNDHDAALGRESKQTTIPDNLEVLMDFEQLPLFEGKESLVTKTLLYLYNKGFKTEATQVDTKTASKDPNLRVTFEKIYVPEEQQVYNRKNMMDAQEALNKHETELKSQEPLEIYVYTKKEEEGIIKFSRPIIIRQIYARLHNYLHYEAQRKEQKKSTRPEHIFVGRYVNSKAVEYFGTTSSTSNKWIKVFPRTPDVAVDSIIIPPNTDIDNILFDIARPEKPEHEGSLSAKDLQDIYQFLTQKLTQYKSITDTKYLLKTVKEDVEIYLKENKYEKPIIDRIVSQIDLVQLGKDEYAIQIGDVTDLMSSSTSGVIDLTKLLGGDPKSIEELKAQLKELQSSGFDFDDNLGEAAYHFADSTPTGKKKTDEKKKDEIGESRIKKN